MLGEGRTEEGRAAGPIRSLLQWSKIQASAKDGPEMSRQHGTPIWGGYIGPIPTNCSLQKCLEEAQVAPGTESCHASLSSGHTCILEPWPLSSWATLDSGASPILMEPTGAFCGPDPPRPPHPDMWLTRPW